MGFKQILSQQVQKSASVKCQRSAVPCLSFCPVAQRQICACVEVCANGCPLGCNYVLKLDKMDKVTKLIFKAN